MGPSVKTLQHRAKDWNIHAFTAITDAELDGVVRECLHQFPQAGEAMLRGHLQSLKIHVQRESSGSLSEGYLVWETLSLLQYCAAPTLFPAQMHYGMLMVTTK